MIAWVTADAEWSRMIHILLHIYSCRWNLNDQLFSAIQGLYNGVISAVNLTISCTACWIFAAFFTISNFISLPGIFLPLPPIADVAKVFLNSC